MKLHEKDKQILAHILRYCMKIKMSVTRFGDSFDIFSRMPIFAILSA